LATIRNTIDTQFTSRGARRVREETESIGRAQTRLGQASAGAGRSFSAQSTGMGGLVGVYAAAAANVFAISAAFEALNAAAKFQTIIRGTEQLANAVGTSAETVINSMKDITNGQLSIAEAAKAANMALSAGFNVNQIQDFTMVATKAAKTLGRDLTDSIQRVTRGIIKLEPELLDELGIFTRIEPAVNAYALQLGKSASQLTTFEKRQAFAVQVTKDGTNAFKDVTLAADSSQASFEKLVATFSDLAIQGAGLIANALAPLADFLNDSLGNQLILLGAVGTLVFGKLATAVGGFVAGGVASLSIGLNTLALEMAAVGTSATAMATRTAAASAAFTGAGALAGSSRGMGSQLKKDLAKGPLSLEQAQEYDPKIKKALEAERKERMKLHRIRRSGVALSVQQNRQMQMSLQRSRALGISMRVVRDQIHLAGTGANMLTRGLAKASAAAAVFGTVMNFALAAVNYIVIALVAIQAGFKFFADIDVFQILLDAYKEMTKESRQHAAGLKEVNSLIDVQGSKLTDVVAIMDAARIDPENRTTEGLRDSMETQVEAIQDYQNQILQIEKVIARSAQLNQSFLPANAGGSPGIAQLALGGFGSQQDFADAVIEVAELKDKIMDAQAAINILGGAFSNVQDIDNFTKFIGKAKEEIEGLTTALSKAFAKGRLDVSELLPTQINSGNQINSGTMKKQVLETRGIKRRDFADSTQNITSPFFAGSRTGALENVENMQFGEQNNKLTLFVDAQDKYTKGSAAFIKATDDTSDAYNKIEELFAGLATGLISDENAGKLLATIRAQMEAAQATIEAAKTDGIFEGRQISQAEKYLATIEEGLAFINQELSRGTERFIAQEKLFLALNKQFSNVNKFIDEAGNTGAINAATGEIATSQKQQLKFQRENFLILSKRLEVLKKYTPEEIKQRGLLAEKQGLEANLLLIAKESFAESVKLLLNSKKQIDAQTTKTKQMQDQLDILKMQNAEAVRLSGIRARDASQQLGLQVGNAAKGEMAGTSIREPVMSTFSKGKGGTAGDILGFAGGDVGIQNMKQTQSAFDAIIKREERRVSLVKQRVAIENEGAAIQRGMRMSAVQAKADAASGAGSLMVMRAEEAATIIEERSLSTTQEILDGRIAVMKAERDAALASIGGQMAVAAEEFKQAKEVIQERRDALILEQETQRDAELNRKTRRADNLEIIRAERQQAIARKALEIQKVADEKQAIISRRDITIKQARMEKEKALIEVDMMQKQFNLLKFKIESDNKFLTRYSDITRDLGKALGVTYEPTESTVKDPTKEALKFIERVAGIGGFLDQQRGIIGDTAKSKIETAGTVATDDESARADNQKRLESQFEQLKNLDALKTSMEDQETTFLEQEAQKQAEMIAMKLENLDLEDQAVKQAFDEKMGALGVEAAVAKEAYRLAKEAAEYDLSAKKRMVELGKSMAFTISDTLGNAMMKFLTNLQEGKPLIEGIGELFTQMLFDIQQQILQKTLIDPMTNAVSDTLIKSFAGFMLASGGTVRHMAEGGQVNSLRDRVPAMLEPGEFVIRKSAAKSIGQSRLGQMNATGAGGMGNVQFNIVNNGEPKSAEQQGAPKIDTDKIVIDVVMRDLKSNGPIRQAMRN